MRPIPAILNHLSFWYSLNEELNMTRLYASIFLICLFSLVHASEEGLESTVSSITSEPTGAVTKKPKKVWHRTPPNEACEFTGNSKADVACSYAKYQAAEARLITRYEQLLLELDNITEINPGRSELKPKLIAAQEAWIKYRESQCRAVEEWYAGGTLQDALYSDCLRSLSEKRIEELNSFTSNQT